MTLTRSQMSATTSRLCVTMIIARPCSRLSSRQLEHLRLHRDIERRRRFVGHDQFGEEATAPQIMRCAIPPEISGIQPHHAVGVVDADACETDELRAPGFWRRSWPRGDRR